MSGRSQIASACGRAVLVAPLTASVMSSVTTSDDPVGQRLRGFDRGVNAQRAGL
jgi:hypothetical protein